LKRDDYTKKLVKLIEKIESGKLPAKVTHLYVFGSYARGALQPHDLDLVVAYEDPGPKYWMRQRAAFMRETGCDPTRAVMTV
jgi:predicted nucleotidyltransferase